MKSAPFFVQMIEESQVCCIDSLQLVIIPMEEGSNQSDFCKSFKLHPMDAYQYSLRVQGQLEEFVNAFKERIEVEIDYSKALFKVSRILAHHVQPDLPTPMSYVCSAFKVENEQRARHSLELAEYLHTQVQIVCQTLLNNQQAESKRLQKQLRKFYKEGENVEQIYQKNLKRYFKSKQDWEEKMIQKCVLMYTPGVTPSQKEKAISKLQDERRDTDSYYQKYVDSLDVFNQFASNYNDSIISILSKIEEKVKQQLNVEADCLRKLIVSEINMFKNIEYDLLNISRQMEGLQLQEQVDFFVQIEGAHYLQPILSIYCEGPLSDHPHAIDYKQPMDHTLMQKTLRKIQNKNFEWALQNRNNSTLRYCMQKIWDKLSGVQQEDTNYLTDFQDIVKTNRVVRDMSVDGREEKLRPEETYSLSFEILTNVAQLTGNQVTDALKYEEKTELLRSYFGLHHFYRFVALIFLEEYQDMHDNRIGDPLIAKSFSQIVKLLLEESYAQKDIFVIRGLIVMIFGSFWEQDGQDKCLFQQPEIADMEIWQSCDFWQAAVFEASYQQISLLPAVQRSELREIYAMRQKNVIFSGLVTYCHYMVMMGLQKKQVRKVLSRFCQIYGLYEEHERDLVKTIANSSQQYKQLNPV